jgi:hypothetical protein
MCWYVHLPHELHLLIITPAPCLLKVEKNGDIDVLGKVGLNIKQSEITVSGANQH